MFRFVGDLCNKDREMIRDFSTYVLSTLIAPIHHKNLFITINFTDPSTLNKNEAHELKKYLAWTVYTNKINDKFYFTITISTTAFRNKKKTIKRLKNVLQCIAHEFVHVKQYYTGELIDLEDERVEWKGKVSYYSDSDLGAYFFSDWEKDAYSTEYAYYAMFKDAEKRKSN
jgi:hypothetical protein